MTRRTMPTRRDDEDDDNNDNGNNDDDDNDDESSEYPQAHNNQTERETHVQGHTGSKCKHLGTAHAAHV